MTKYPVWMDFSWEWVRETDSVLGDPDKGLSSGLLIECMYLG